MTGVIQSNLRGPFMVAMTVLQKPFSIHELLPFGILITYISNAPVRLYFSKNANSIAQTIEFQLCGRNNTYCVFLVSSIS